MLTSRVDFVDEQELWFEADRPFYCAIVHKQNKYDTHEQNELDILFSGRVLSVQNNYQLHTYF